MPGLGRRAPGQQPAEATADHDHLDLVGERFALDRSIDVGVVDVVGEVALHLDVLLVAVVAQTLVALLAVLLPEGVGIEVEIFGGRVGGGHHLLTRRSRSNRSMALPRAILWTALGVEVAEQLVRRSPASAGTCRPVGVVGLEDHVVDADLVEHLHARPCP